MNSIGSTFFLTRARRVRYIFKILSFASLSAAGVALFPLLPYHTGFEFEYFALGIIVISFFLIKQLERRPAATLGLAWNAFTGRQCFWGFATGTAMISFVVTMEAVFGGATLTPILRPLNDAFALCAHQLIISLFVAATEELLFRGYLYQAAIESSNATVATAVFSILFAAGHASNPGITALGYANIFLAGILFAGAYLRTRQLWLPIALHASWNFFEGTIYGAGVSGESAGGSLATFAATGPAWLTGGSFGPEAGIVTTIVLIIGIALIQAAPQFQISPEQFALLHRVRYAEDAALLRAERNAA